MWRLTPHYRMPRSPSEPWASPACRAARFVPRTKLKQHNTTRATSGGEFVQGLTVLPIRMYVCMPACMYYIGIASTVGKLQRSLATGCTALYYVGSSKCTGYAKCDVWGPYLTSINTALLLLSAEFALPSKIINMEIISVGLYSQSDPFYAIV